MLPAFKRISLSSWIAVPLFTEAIVSFVKSEKENWLICFIPSVVFLDFSIPSWKLDLPIINAPDNPPIRIFFIPSSEPSVSVIPATVDSNQLVASPLYFLLK